MSGSWPKIIRDPVHDVILFQDCRCDRLLLDLLSAREVQRLRRIKQLGFTELVFPGANHSRFAHSLGVLQIARHFLDHFGRVASRPPDEDQRTLILAVSLLHDVGHGPFSHAFEKVTGARHEAYTRDVIKDEASDVHQKLKAFDPQMPERLAMFFDEEADQDRLSAVAPPYLARVISSQLDADRCDYLLRDSYATGTDYGNYDIYWLLPQLHVRSDEKHFYLGRKALSVAEAYVFARFHMYRTVYFHKTTRAAEVMLRLLFRRFKELLTSAKNARAAQKIVPGAPPNLVLAFTGQMTLEAYLSLDDHTITEFLKSCHAARDPVLRELSDGLLNRRLYKSVEASNKPVEAITSFRERGEALASGEADPRYAFAMDTPRDTPYKLYDPDAEKPATQIYLETGSGALKELSTVSEPVNALRKPYELVRYYFPERLRDRMDTLAAELLAKE
jgi:uncharacterized protein